MKIVTILGARPQFIKAAMVSKEFAKHRMIEEVIVHTGQHFDLNMSDIFFDEMEIPRPKYHLGINGLTHGAMTGQMLAEIEKLLMTEMPDCVVVYGDTNSTLAGALAAAKVHIPIAHIEAGLRSYNMRMPEEINRVLTDRIATLLLCPTRKSIDNLKQEGFDSFDCRVALVGDVMLDAALHYGGISEIKSTIISRLGLVDSQYLLATVHREENTGSSDRLKQIIMALNIISDTYRVVVPIHPRTKKIIEKYNLAISFDIIEPVGYFDMIELLKHCKLVLTDSGGLQKEAFFFKKYCVTLRDETEWVELVESGYNYLAGSDCDRIVSLCGTAIEKKSNFTDTLYGDGDASYKICQAITSAFL